MRDLFRLFGFLRRFSGDVPFLRTLLTLVLVSGVIAGAANVGLLVLVNRGLSGGAITPLWVWAFVALCLLMPATRFASGLLQIHLAERAQKELRGRLTRQILATPYERLAAVGPQRLLVALTRDVTSVTGSLNVIPGVLLQLATILCCVGYLVWLSPPLSLLVIAFAALGLPTFLLPMLRGMKWLYRARDTWDGVFKLFQGLVDGTRELKLHAPRSREFVADVDAVNESFRRSSVRGKAIYSAANVWGQFLFFALIGVLLAVPGLPGVPRSEVAIGYTLTLLYMMAPLQLLLTTAPRLAEGNVARRKLLDLMLSRLPPAGDEVPVPPQPAASGVSLELRGVTYRYASAAGREEGFAVGPIDLVLRPGELVFLIGGNGSGKTTLLHVLTGLFAPSHGEIAVDGRVVAEDGFEAYRQLFSMVFQDFHLFARLRGLERPDLDGEAHDWLRRLQLDDEVAVVDGAFSTVDLSRGQRKRLALLAACLEDRPVYLFDEWAADQDPVFKEVFYLDLLPRLREAGKTVLVVTHDDAYYPLADRILRLDQGRVAFDLPAAEYQDVHPRRLPRRSDSTSTVWRRADGHSWQ